MTRASAPARAQGARKDKQRTAAAISFVPPQLATLVTAAPAGDDWLHEVKFDGFRVLCRIQDSAVTLFTRSGQDWTDRFTPVAEAAARLQAPAGSKAPTGSKVRSALLDGEVAILRPDGTTSFQSLQNHIQGDGTGALTYFAFDLLFLDGQDLRPLPLEDRKAALERLLVPGARGAAASSPRVIRYTDHVIGNGPAFFEKASAAGLEGIISKLRREPYHSGRGPSWVKTKAMRRHEFVIGGFTEPEGARSGIGALLVGFFREGALIPAGKVGTGFTNKVAAELRRRLDGLASAQSPFKGVIPGAGRQLHWVKPELVAEIAYSEMTADGKLRHPSFQGLREDKRAGEVVQEVPRPVTSVGKTSGHLKSGRATSEGARSRGAGGEVAGVKLTHPDRVLDQQAGTTKRDHAGYLEAVAPLMLPHLVGRPLSLVRCPAGTAGKCFFMKHAAFATPGLRRITIEEKATSGEYLIADTAPGLVGLAQMGVLEIHTWNSVDATLELPDRVVFDFDPGPQARWQDVVAGARLIKARVEQMGCASFVKTTGGKGLHVVVPLFPRAGWDDCRMFSQIISESVVA
ncbi:MAG: DNA ligase D, partial [Polyangia bacterium]